MLTWSSDGQRRLETVRTVITERGLRANGYIVQAGSYGASYSLLVDAQGRSRRITVQSDSPQGERHLSLTRTPGGPWVVESTSGSNPLHALDEALDVDLESSTFTNALILRRTRVTSGDPDGPGVGAETKVTVARISMPTLTVEAVEQSYTYRGDGVVSFRGPIGQAELTVDENSFVIDFPGVSHRLN